MTRIRAFMRLWPMIGTTTATFKPIPPNEIEGLDSISITYGYNEIGNVANTVTSDLVIKGTTAQTILAAADTDLIEISLYDTVLKVYYPTFTAQAETRTVCIGSGCTVKLTAVTKKEVKTCFDDTVIWDNFQSWFDTTGTKKHTRIGYCNAPNVNAFAGILYVLSLLLAVIFSVFSFILSIIGITGVSNFLSSIINSVKGCELAHPSPFVRDYIKNVCDKCGVIVDAASFPLFFNTNSIYYNTVVFYAPTTEGFAKTDTNFNKYYIENNVYNKTLTEFLNELATHFNGKWQEIDNTLTFIEKNSFYAADPIYRFLDVDKALLIDDICYAWNGQTKPAYFDGIYTQDGIDLRGNTAMPVYNDIVEFNSPPSPSQSGKLAPSSPFAAARFRNDGITNDPVTKLEKNGILNAMVSYLTVLGFNINTYQRDLVISDDQTSKAKLLIWDNFSGIDSGLIINRRLLDDPPLFFYLQNEVPLSQTDTNYDIYLYNAPYHLDHNINDGNYGGVPIPNLWRFWSDENPRSEAGKRIKNRTYTITICLSVSELQKLGLLLGNTPKLGFSVAVSYENNALVSAEITEITINLATNSITITAKA